MKNLYLLILAFSLLIPFSDSKAATVVVDVEDFEFNPSIFIVNMGDTILWMYNEGQHTTTSTQIPAGAATWDQVLTQNSPVFIYIPTVAGSYDYECSFHASMGMLGHFTVLSGASSIAEESSVHAFSGIITQGRELEISYALMKSSMVNITIHDLIGNEICTVLSQDQTPGEYTFKRDLPSLSGGIYFLILVTKDAKLTKRIWVN